MSTDIIYRSIVKQTGEEVLVYKNIIDKYRDLRSRREFSEDELTDFISLSKMLGMVTSVSKNQAIQLYYDCKNSEIEFHSVYIGDLATIELDEDSQFKVEIIAKNRVFKKMNNQYIDLVTYESYKIDDFTIGDTVVINSTLIGERFNNELPGSRQSKQKIIRFCQNKFSNIQ